MQTITIKKKELIKLIQLAQTEDSDWEDEYDRFFGLVCKKYNNIHIPPQL